MIIKDLEQHYIVYKHKKDYHLHSLTENGRMNHKYLCSITKKGDTFKLNSRYTKNIDVLNEEIQEYLNNLEYDSEYFYPLWRKGLKESLYIHDYMTSLGFKSNYNTYTYKPKNIYGGNTTKIEVSFYGLGDMGFTDTYNPDKLEIILWNSDFSWITTKIGRNFKSIKEGIDSLLNPLLLTESVKNISITAKMDSIVKDIKQGTISGLNIITSDYKKELKEKLLQIVNSIEN